MEDERPDRRERPRVWLRIPERPEDDEPVWALPHDPNGLVLLPVEQATDNGWTPVHLCLDFGDAFAVTALLGRVLPPPRSDTPPVEFPTDGPLRATRPRTWLRQPDDDERDEPSHYDHGRVGLLLDTRFGDAWAVVEYCLTEADARTIDAKLSHALENAGATRHG